MRPALCCGYSGLVTVPQMLVKDAWGENMALMVSATGNITSAIYNLSFVILAGIMFSNLFIGIICAAFVRYSGVHDSYRAIEQRLVAQALVRKFFLRLRFLSRVRAAARTARRAAPTALTPLSSVTDVAPL